MLLSESLNKKQYKTLLVLTEVYRQQFWLFENNKQSIEDRIVSLSQPHIRPIVRGKAGKPVEFGAKLSASCFEGYVFLDRSSWDNFNESGDLKAQIEASECLDRILSVNQSTQIAFIEIEKIEHGVKREGLELVGLR